MDARSKEGWYHELQARPFQWDGFFYWVFSSFDILPRNDRMSG